MPSIHRLRTTPLPALLALVALLLSGAAAEVATAKKPKGKPRINVSRMGKPPTAAVEVGDKVTIEFVVRNRGRKPGRTPIKLIVPKEDGATSGRKLAAIESKRIKPKSKRTFELSFDVPEALAPGANDTEAQWDLAACVRRHGEGTKFRCKTSKRKLRVEIPPLPPNFEPGGRSAGDPLFPQIGNTGYDALSYDLDLDYNPSNNRFRAGTKTAMVAETTQNLGEFSLDFQRLDVTRVTVDGETAAFDLVNATPVLEGATQPVKLVVTPPEGIPDGTEFTVVVRYHGEPVEIIDPDGSSEGWVRACLGVPSPVTCDGAVVVNEPVGAAGWFPNNNVPADKATFETSITTPDSHTALGIGELASKEILPGGEAKWTWVEDDPTATYLTTATVGEFIYTEDTITEAATSRTLPAYYAIDSLATAPQQTALETSYARIESMVDFLGEDFGPYPFDSGGAIADNVPTLGYALEVQTKPVFATLGRNDNTMLHEYAHQWFGNSVSPATWLEIWFNEGWAEWAAWYWEFEANGGPDSPAVVADDEYAGASNADWSVPPATLNGDPAELFNFFAGYVRSPMMLQYYREIVGDAAFFGLAESIQDEFAYSTITTAQFIDRAKTASGFSGAQLDLLDDFFQQWLYGDVKPTILPESF